MYKWVNLLKSILVLTLLFNLNLNAQTVYPKDSLLKKVMKSNEQLNAYTEDSAFFLKLNNVINNRIPPKYPELRKEDVMFSETIWEDINVKEKKNRVFYTSAEREDSYQNFYKILLNVIESDTNSIKVYSPIDDRFTTKVSYGELLNKLKGAWRLDPEIDSTGTPTGKTIPIRHPDENTPSITDSIYTFRIKAQYIFDSRTSRMHYRILGICPIASLKKTARDSSGNEIFGKFIYEKQPLFWLYYPSLRNQLANYKVYNPNNLMRQIAWSDLLEARYFDAHIVKTSYNNYTDQNFFETIKDPKKRLEAADKIKERIDNFEEDRWVY